MFRLFARTPLRIRLVSGVMLLVAAALLVISVASTWALRSYLTSRTDADLNAVAQAQVQTSISVYNNPGSQAQLILPSKYYMQVVDEAGQRVAAHGAQYKRSDLPRMPETAQEAAAKVNKPYTAVAEDGHKHWRMLVTRYSTPGSYLTVSEDISDVDNAVSRLLLSELLVGAGVLILLALLGAGLVRTSLKPLREIERTAAAIAGGDLTQRVPEFEPGEARPHTEMGRVGRALNTMLGHVEAAFTAQVTSENAARAAAGAARQAAAAAQRSEARARRSEERMRQFVADASHELRTPLTSIRGFAELYRQGAAADPRDAQRLVRRIEDEAARMGLLVEDLLLLARLDRERPLSRSPLDLRVIAHDAVTAAQAVAPEREIALSVPPSTGPLLVSADESRLRQVVGNLMTNALTHTPAGTPVWLRLDRSAGQAVIEVADAGPGLSAQQRERVFERFYRADAARTRRGGASSTSGTGLGLAIVAVLVAAHEGTVEVESEPGRGAIFRVRLPLAPDDPPAAGDEPTNPARLVGDERTNPAPPADGRPTNPAQPLGVPAPTTANRDH